MASKCALLTLSVLILSLLGRPATAGPSSITGVASVIDGDTIEIHDQRIRLWGIDAPEADQSCQRNDKRWRCGREAAFALADYLSKARPLPCVEVDRDRWQRMVAICYRADGTDVAAWLVHQGWALDWPRYSGGRYAAQQALARANGAGLWQGTFDAPWEWRASKHGS